MKRAAYSGIRLLAISAALLLVGSAESSAQTRNLYEVSGGMDVQFASDRFTSFWNTGGGADFAFNRYLSKSAAITIGATFNRFAIDPGPVEDYVSAELPDSLKFLVDFLDLTDGDVTVFAGRVGLSHDFELKDSSFENTNEGKILFYARAAVGGAYNAISDLELSLLGESAAVEGSSKFGFTVEGGGGFRFFLTNGLGLSLESVLVANFLSGETLLYLPIRLGVFVAS